MIDRVVFVAKEFLRLFQDVLRVRMNLEIDSKLFVASSTVVLAGNPFHFDHAIQCRPQ